MEFLHQGGPPAPSTDALQYTKLKTSLALASLCLHGEESLLRKISRGLTGGAVPFKRTSIRASSHLRWYSRTRSLWLLSMVTSSFCKSSKAAVQADFD